MAFDTPISAWPDGAGGDHFARDLEAGLPLHETREYYNLMRMIESGRRPKGLRDDKEVLTYLEGVVDTFNRIREQGLDRPDHRDRGIEVCVDETGRLCKVWGGGTHRYGLIRTLGPSIVPVYVRHAHRQWLDGLIARDPRAPLRAVDAGIAALADA
jgi:hypothetical protein